MSLAPRGDPLDAPVTLVVLAGGRSRRFGSDKALASIDEAEPLALRALRRLGALAPRRVLVRAAPMEGVPADVLRVADPRPGDGPLQALAAAFAAHPAARWLVAPCDAPNLEPSTYERLLRELASAEAADAAVASVRGRLEPLVSIWTPRAAAPLPGWLAREPQLAVHEALSRLDVVTVEFDDPRPFVNVNARADLETASEGARAGART